MLLMPVQSYRQQKNVMLFFPLVPCLQLHYSTAKVMMMPQGKFMHAAVYSYITAHSFDNTQKQLLFTESLAD